MRSLIIFVFTWCYYPFYPEQAVDIDKFVVVTFSCVYADALSNDFPMSRPDYFALGLVL